MSKNLAFWGADFRLGGDTPISTHSSGTDTRMTNRVTLVRFGEGLSKLTLIVEAADWPALYRRLGDALRAEDIHLDDAQQTPLVRADVPEVIDPGDLLEAGDVAERDDGELGS